MTYNYEYIGRPVGNLKLIVDGGPNKQPRPMTATERSERFPAHPPENLALPIGTWVHRNDAARTIAKANGCPDDLEKGACWLQAMIRTGLCDCKGNEVKLMTDAERAGTLRPGSPEAVNEEARLAGLKADLAALGLRVVPEESV